MSRASKLRAVGRQPFTLRAHFSALVGDAKRMKSKPVAEVDGWAIVRIQNQEIKPSSAQPHRESVEAKTSIAAAVGAASSLLRDGPLSRALAAVKELDERNENYFLARIAYECLAALAFKSRNGDGEALFRFVPLAVQGAESLSQIMRAHPKAVQPIAKDWIRWPLMCSTHPHFCDNRKLLKEIRLGSAMPGLSLDQYSKWKRDRAAGVALDLFWHLDRMRQENPMCLWAGGVEKRLQEYLQPFTKSSAVKWWSLAKHELLRSYPQPQKIPELARLCTTKSRMKSPGRMKEQILSKIKARFLHMAGVKTWPESRPD